MKMSENQLDQFLKQATQGSLSPTELESNFLEGPAGTSQELAIQSRIKRAAFPTEVTLESYDWTRSPKSIRKETFLELASGQFIQRKENVAFVGASGLGKTHLIQAVGRKCCALGYRVRYETSASLIETLNKARAIKALTPKVKKYCRQATDRNIHDDSAFSVNPVKNVYRCFRCGSGGNALDFWLNYRAITLHQAAVELSHFSKTSNSTHS